MRHNIDFNCRIFDECPYFRTDKIPSYLNNSPRIVMRRLQRREIRFRTLHESLRSHPGVCMEAVKVHGGNLKYVRDCACTYEVVLEAVKREPFALKNARRHKSNFVIIVEALKQKTHVAKFIDDKLRNSKDFLRSLPTPINLLEVASPQLARAGINYIWFDDDMLNHTQPYLPPEIQRQVLHWII